MKIGGVFYINCGHKTNVEKQYEIHGHTYKIEVSVSSVQQKDYIIPFDEFKEKINLILSKYDYKYLNDFLDNPTLENFIVLLHKEIKESFPSYGLHLKVWQGNQFWAEYP